MDVRNVTAGVSNFMIELDGSLGEGGGQILRTSLALSLLTGQVFHLRNVRAGRAKPGLQPQHLMSVRAAAEIGQARLRGASRDSTDLVFEPGPVTAGRYQFAIGTAGATGLVLHTVYLPLALRGAGPSELVLEGGTHVSTSPCFHFLDTTWRAYLELLGVQMRLRLSRPGFYPKGGGHVDVTVQPCSHLQGLQLLERSAPQAVTGVSAVAGLPLDIARRQARRAANRLKETELPVDIREETWPGGPGTVLTLILDTQPAPTMFFGLGARGKRAERVADEAVDQLLDYLAASPAAVDPHSADQIVLPLALAEGPSAFTVTAVTSHLLTNIAVIGRFIERRITCEGEEGQPGLVKIA
jgi:RNA 3'-terminal phosphate cyclase (ATP)